MTPDALAATLWWLRNRYENDTRFRRIRQRRDVLNYIDTVLLACSPIKITALPWREMPMAGKAEKVMHEFKHGELHSGSKKGPKVTSRKQAIAIAMSEARKAGEKTTKRKR